MPYFSLVVPVYNRERVVARCLDSILEQNFENFELIVVDDCSTDRSVSVIEKYLGSKVRLLRHTKNLGVCPTRNTGFVASRGEWILSFDSDDEMAKDALRMIYDVTLETPTYVDRVKFMVRYSTGELSPYPPFRDEIIDYHEYVKRLDIYIRGEGQTVFRYPIGNRDIWPKDRSIETLFHLDRMRRGVMRTIPQIARIYHRDAGNQFHQVYDMKRIMGPAPDMAKMFDEILERHGPILEANAPKCFRSFLTEACKFSLLSGRRAVGFKYFINAARYGCFGRVWPYTALGLISKNLLAFSLGKAKQTLNRNAP